MAAKKKSGTLVVSVRMSEAMMEEVDKLIPRIAKEHWEGTTTSRGDALRYLIRAGIESVKTRKDS